MEQLSYESYTSHHSRKKPATNGQNILTLVIDLCIELRRKDNLEKVWKETLAALNLSADVP